MKIVLFRDNLKNGLTVAEKAIGESSHLPILKNILIKTHNDKIRLVTTNLELAITKFISGKIIENGALTIPFHTFYNIVSNITQDRIQLEKNENNFLFKTDNYQAKIQGVVEDEFPLIPKMENNESYLEIDPNIFKSALSQVINATQVSEIRPEISGILLDCQLTILKLVATDSFRLAEKTITNQQFKHNFNKSWRVIIPLKTAQEIIRVFPNDQVMKIYPDNNQILFKNNDVEVISRLIEGSYPDYDPIIPKELESELVVNRDHLINSLKLVNNFSGKTNDVRLAIREEQKVLDVYAANQFLGENNYLIPAKAKGNNFQDVAFNWRFFLDGLRAIDEENVFLGVNGASRPAIIRPLNDQSYFYILMPIRI